MEELDKHFFERADEHIQLSNKQLSETTRGKVSASMLYSVARYNTWVSACGFDSKKDMENSKEEIIEYFVTEYKKMLNENLEEYISNFEDYMKK